MNSEQRAVLAHVVVDPDQWWAHVQAQFPDRAQALLESKCAVWRASYEAASAQPGYLPRADRPRQAPAERVA